MTDNQRAKIAPALILALVPAAALGTPALLEVPTNAPLFYAQMGITTVLSFGLAGAKQAPKMFGVAYPDPLYWLPMLIWLLGVAIAAGVAAIPGCPPGARWLVLGACTLHVLADCGNRFTTGKP